ncbi:MAG TPA: heme o synthase, partial [Nitrolancea sp.]|nr:heme o synthase [Nitrolancea sp.]
MSRFQKVAIASLGMAYLLLIAGAVVRLTGAGLGCGSQWPFCNGQFVPSSTGSSTVYDFTHRLLALLVSVLVVALVVDSWTTRKSKPLLFWGSVTAGVLVVAQVALGAITAVTTRSTGMDIAHLGLAQVFLAVLLFLVLVALAPTIAELTGRPTGRSLTGLGWSASIASISTFALILTGSYIATSNAATACDQWPLCNGRIVPTGFTPTDIHIIHRWIALITAIAVIAVAVQAWRLRSDSPLLVSLAMSVATITVVQIFVGAASVWFQLNAILDVAHLGAATIVWGLLLLIVALDRMIPVAAVERPVAVGSWRVRVRQVASDYFTLTKPGVMLLLLITTLCGMLIAQAGLPPLRILFWTLVGGALSSGGAAAMNHYMDRDIDEIMKRTRKRPLPGKRIPVVNVPIFSLTLTVLGVYVLAVFVNPLAAMLSLTGNLFYVLVYTKYLKRSTPQNIVIGGAAGALPPMVGWVAVTNHIGLAAVLLFAVVFYWTPPHFWSLALFTSSDYAAANVPMFPEVYGATETRKHIFLYTVMLVITTLFFFPLRIMGPVYLGCALVFGGIFLYKTYNLTRHPDDQKQLSKS